LYNNYLGGLEETIAFKKGQRQNGLLSVGRRPINSRAGDGLFFGLNHPLAH
jgi:hypothetical protein